jgi:nicotinate-nucleotide pyrophosphorylase (carboxylating)
LQRARDVEGDILVEVEVESIDELKEALDAGATRIPNLREAVSTNADYGYARAELEASGNVTLDSLRQIADTGVDYISTGALTKNIHAVDLSMLFRID